MSDETPANDPHAELDSHAELAEIRQEREKLEKLKLTLNQPRRDRELCGAKTSGGSSCRRYPIKGGTRCVLHGGGSPLARMEAERRLLYGVSLALDRLLDALSEHEHEGECPTCGCNASSRDPNTLRAAIALLDRSGFGPGLKLTTEDREDGIREVRVTIVEPDPERLAEYEASDREAAAAAKRNAYNQELDPEPEPEQPQPTDGRNALVIDLEAN